MRYTLIFMWMLLWPASPAMAQVSIGIGLPGVSIGINLPLYPELVRVPGYPVYYAPQLDSNFFFYDGMYWVYQNDDWYASSWYNGPWALVDREVVPLFVLRVPVRYYRAPPGYFRGWRADAPPRWGDQWGNAWQQRRSGWDRWDRHAIPAPAPLPVYQRQYSGDRYPRLEQQRTLQAQNYRYQPRDNVVRQHYQEQIVQKPPAPSRPEQRGAPQDRTPQGTQRPAPPPPPPQMQQQQQQQQGGPAVPRPQPQRPGDDVQRPDVPRPAQAPQLQKPPAVQEQRQQPQPQQGADPREQQKGRSNQERESAPQGKGAPQEDRRGKAQDKDRDKGEERGPDRSR